MYQLNMLKEHIKSKTPATTTSVSVPAKYETRTYQNWLALQQQLVFLFLQNILRTYQKLVTPATTTRTTVPAKWVKEHTKIG